MDSAGQEELQISGSGAEKYEGFPFGMNFSLRARGSRMLEGTKTRPYVVSANPTAFNNLKKMPAGGTSLGKLGRAFKSPVDVPLFVWFYSNEDK